MKHPAPLPLEEAQARLIALAQIMPGETIPVELAAGRVLAEPLAARRTQPPADLSAMDGYTVRAGDSSGPWRIVGESAAGHPFSGSLSAGEAVRISTGALMPADADCVILQEDVARDGDRLTLTGDGPDPEDKHVRRRGLDFLSGEAIMAAGTRLGPAQLALAISAGHAEVSVHRLPRVAIIDSGDELASSPSQCALHQIPASNGAMLAAMLRESGCEARRIGPVADDLDALRTAFANTGDCEVIVTSGGASVGDHDLVRPALESLGAHIDFWRVAIKPGKPLLIATLERNQGRQIIVGLPGNPVSSFVTAYLFALPLLRAMMGHASPLPRSFETRSASLLRAIGSRREFVRGYWDGESVTAMTVQDSGALASLAASNVLIDRPANAPATAPGETIRVYLTGNGGIA
ncbi:MAG: molybdopterin molybdotransferase MoeA [Novosphingobium sp.]|nr:molybdopterin molybdotransferase MoeA [Novosphingobium sp.]